MRMTRMRSAPERAPERIRVAIDCPFRLVAFGKLFFAVGVKYFPIFAREDIAGAIQRAEFGQCSEFVTALRGERLETKIPRLAGRETDGLFSGACAQAAFLDQRHWFQLRRFHVAARWRRVFVRVKLVQYGRGDSRQAMNVILKLLEYHDFV